MKAKTYNSLLILTTIIFLIFIGLFILFLIYTFIDGFEMDVIDTLSAVIYVLAAMLALHAMLIFLLVSRNAMRFVSLINRLLDPAAATELFEESKKFLLRRKINDNIFLCLIHDLKGEYEPALREFNLRKLPRNMTRHRLTQAYHLLRCGMLEESRAIMQEIEPSLSGGTRLLGGELHTLGLYYLECEEPEKAKRYFFVSCYLEETSIGIHTNISRLNCYYDLARLYQREGKSELSFEYYLQAAAIGPKTWLGQEAARRAKALQRAQQHHADEKEAMDIVGEIELPD